MIAANGTYGILLWAIGMLSGWIIWGWAWSSDKPTGEISTALSITRELRCQEDEDIVVTLGANGLPLAYCFQVRER